jgi:predicted ABC-class ATPase
MRHRPVFFMKIPAMNHEQLRTTLLRIDGRGYKAYRDVVGQWSFATFTLHIDHVQGDPFAAPSRVRAILTPAVADFPEETYANRSRAVGVAALLARRFAGEARQTAPRRGTGKSGRIEIECPGQEVLAQTAVQLHSDGTVEARFTVALPAQGRRVLGRQAAELLLEDLPAVVAAALTYAAYADAEVWQHAAVNEDAETLRAQLAARRLVAFVADGAILPRRSGVDDRPLTTDDRVPFHAPAALCQTFTLPHAGVVTGMGIPAGVTLIVGGGYHGKSTLLRAIERGVYNHRPGDGRELVVSDAGLVKIRAEDGRAVSGVDISGFINNLPLGRRTDTFQTDNASGSTSQAAAIVEALEAGATGLLIDEDTAATNFMIRDSRMQTLVPKAQEPITPFVDRVRQLYDEHGVSSLLVIGGSGDYLDGADTVVAMDAFVPHDVTAQAHAIAAAQPTGRQREGGAAFPSPRPRRPQPASLDPSRGRRDVNIKTRDVQTIQFGEETIDLGTVEQLLAWPQTRAVGEALWYMRRTYMDGQRGVAELLDLVLADIAQDGLDVLDRRQVGDLAEFRRYELAAALNRLRTLRVG